MPTFEIHQDLMGKKIVFSGEIFESEIGRLKLDPVDRALMDGRSESAADCLLVLEMLYRRNQEQTASPLPETPTEKRS